MRTTDTARQPAAERRKSVAPGERSAASVTRGSCPLTNPSPRSGRQMIFRALQHALGAFYVRTGNKTGAMQQYYILKDLDPKLAADLLKLIPK